jgi:hypothetical protein
MNQNKSWKKTTDHLTNAFRLLPENLKEGDTETIASYREFLEQNELELAMEQLEGLGEQNTCSPLSVFGGYNKRL